MLLTLTSVVGYSQNSSILSDELYLKYEAAYVDYVGKTAPTLNNLDRTTMEFTSKFDDKATVSFNKSKDKIKWLKKNINKTSFENAEQAVSLYSTIKNFEDFQEESGRELTVALDELLKKYDRDAVYQALKSRLLKQ